MAANPKGTPPAKGEGASGPPSKDHDVTALADLEALYGQASPHALGKETPVINDAYRRLIEAAPFVALATLGAGGLDCSPRGDGPGFVRILDERTLALPDRRGNNRLDTLRNVLEDPRVALMFLIPGVEEILRVNGKARISAAPPLLEALSIEGKAPRTVLIVEIDTMYFQCARAVKRSGLWSADAQVDRSTLPSAGQLTRSVIEDFDASAYDAALEDRQRDTLY